MGWNSIEAFWALTRPQGSCILWIGKRFPNGYGCVVRKGKGLLAHRFSFEISVGPIPLGLNICHSCDNPSCVNPKHLWAGTQRQNILDAKAKGRIFTGPNELMKRNAIRGDQHWTRKHPERLQGEKNPAAKLTEETVLAIRKAYELKEGGYISLAKRFNSTKGAVERIIKRDSWGWLQ